MTLRELADRARQIHPNDPAYDFARGIIAVDQTLDDISCSSLRGVVTPNRVRRDFERKFR